MSRLIAVARTTTQDAVAQSGSLPKGLAMLELLSRGDAPMGVTALARSLDMPKSGVHRLLQVLRVLGWVIQTDTGEYQCTLKLWELGQCVGRRIELRSAAAPAMRELSVQTRETILLSILDGTDVMYIEALDSPQQVRVHTNPGDRAPAFCMATGKALLAYASVEVLNAVVANLKKFTPTTIATRKQLEVELEGVRRKGYAVSRGEWDGGVRAVAAPILDSYGQVVAAISIGGPNERMTETVIRRMAPLVVVAAQQVSHELGHRA